MSEGSSAPRTAERFFWYSFWITAALQVVLAVLIPVTGDEAYFVVWGEHLDYGYYDHGPMTGWWLGVFLLLGKSALTIRLPAILSSLAIGWLIRRTLRDVDREKAALVAGLFLWSPHNVLNVLMTTDTPLVFLSVVSALFAVRAIHSDSSSEYLWSGLFLGLAFLAKYFAVVLGFAYAVLFLFFCDKQRIRGLILVVLAVCPSAAINIIWNYNHGWTNLLFNFLTRQEGSGFSLLTTPAFIGVSIALMGPVAYFLLRKKVSGRVPWSSAWEQLEATGLKPWFILFAVPHVVFLFVSVFHTIGVHWVLSFYPFLFLALAGLFAADGLHRIIRPMQVFSGILVFLVVVVTLLPVSVARKHKSYPTIVAGTHPGEVLKAIAQLDGDYLLATPSYTRSALLNFYRQEYVPVLGSYSYHGRQDDLISYVKTFDGLDFAVVVNKREISKVTAMFETTELRELDVMGAKLPVILGHNFQYASYRANSLQWIADTYYHIPPRLVSWSPRSFFLEKYDLEYSPPGEELPDPREKYR